MQRGLDTLRGAFPATLREGRGESPNTVLDAPERLREQAEAAQWFAQGQHAPATRRAYAADFRAFEGWCRLPDALGLHPGFEVAPGGGDTSLLAAQEFGFFAPKSATN